MLAGIFSFAILSCENPEGEPKPNAPPNTTLANVPPNDTIALYIRFGAIPEQTLFWIGGDEDGFVVAYRYRWTDIYSGTAAQTPWTTVLNLTTLGGFNLDTLILVRGTPSSWFKIYNFLATLNPDDATTRERIRDSLGTGRVFAVPYPTGVVPGDSLVGADPLKNEAPTKGVFLFDSPSDSNMHRFEVSSIDNSDAIDPTPAVTNFWTLRSPGPTIFFSQVPPNGLLVLRYPTERNPGLLFRFGGIDPSTDEREYSWSVDDTLHWSDWDLQPQAIVAAIDFHHETSDTHRIFVRARNRWGVLSPIINATFVASVPPIDDPNWPKRVLIINNCRDYVSPAFPAWMPPVDTSDVNNFYIDVMSPLGRTLGGTNEGDFDIWTTSSHSYAFPSRDVFGRYTSVLLLSEQELSRLNAAAVRNRFTSNNLQTLNDYLYIGGKLIFSGPPNIVYAFPAPFSPPLPAVSGYETWADEFLHLVTRVSQPLFTLIQNESFDFAGAKGHRGYPNVVLDSTKLPPEAGGLLRNIAINFPRGFGQTISFFDSKSDSVGFEDAPLGVRYLAPPPIPPTRQTYSVVYFGFPLYYAERSDVIETLRKAFEDINE
jgi:hypothetical protein